MRTPEEIALDFMAGWPRVEFGLYTLTQMIDSIQSEARQAGLEEAAEFTRIHDGHHSSGAVCSNEIRREIRQAIEQRSETPPTGKI